MKKLEIPFDPVAGTIRGGAAAAVVVVLIALGSLMTVQLESWTDWLIAGLILAAAAGLAYLLAGKWLTASALEYSLQKERLASETRIQDLQSRLGALQVFNSLLAEAQDERSLMEDVLALIGDLTRAQAVSYVPLDEWGQPLASILHGDAPAEVMDAWKSHLGSTDVAQKCRDCKLRQAGAAGGCPLAGHPFPGVEGIHCFRVQRAGRALGMLNLYLPAQISLSADLGDFLEGILAVMALAIETVRLRNQEIKTLRQLQLFRDPRMDVSGLMANLLENARQALEVDIALLLLPGPGQGGGRLILGDELVHPFQAERIKTILEKTLAGGAQSSVVEADPHELPYGVTALLAIPVRLPDSHPIGMLAVAHTRPHVFQPREIRVLETVTNQAALLIENDRLVGELEYRAVIQERTRLAREIHDGLAQTLAFLKLQVAQLQSALTRGDLNRSREIARISHETLTSAYLDARQAIDNLRIEPETGGQRWLEQTVRDFQTSTGTAVQLSIHPDAPELLPEVQSQLIRVVQEALNNVRKHAYAKRVEVALYAWQSDWILEIMDDGRGFSSDDIPATSQYGLRGMRERAEMIGVDFQIISQPNCGTTVRLRLPSSIEEASV